MEEARRRPTCRGFSTAAGQHEVKAGLGIGDHLVGDSYCSNGSGQPCAAGAEGYFFQDVVDANDAPFPYVMQVARRRRAAGVRRRVRQGIPAGRMERAAESDRQAGSEMGPRQVRQPDRRGRGHLEVPTAVGIAWDVGGDGKTAVRASWGRFMHPGTAILSYLTNETNYPTEWWLSCSSFVSADPEECAAFAEPTASATAGTGELGPRGVGPAAWKRDGCRAFTGRRRSERRLRRSVDRGNRARALRQNALEITYVNKNSKNGFDDTCNGNYPER